MANEITVRTQVTFMDDDGTTYPRDISFKSDASTTASRPKRLVFYAYTTPTTILDFGTSDEWKNQLRGAAMLLLINRDPAKTMQVDISSVSMNETRFLPPGTWLYLDVCEGNDGALGGGGSFTYGSEPILNVTVATDFQTCKGELLTIYKAAS